MSWYKSISLVQLALLMCLIGLSARSDAGSASADKAFLIDQEIETIPGPMVEPAHKIDLAGDQELTPIIPLRISSLRSPGTPLGLTTHESQYWQTNGRRIVYDYDNPIAVHMVWTYQENFNFFDPSLGVQYQVFNSESGYELEIGGLIVSDLPYSWIPTCSVYPDNRFVLGCQRNGYTGSVAAVYTEMVPDMAIFTRYDPFPATDSSWYFDGLITPFPNVEVHQGTDTVTYVLALAYDLNTGETVGLVLYRKVNSGFFDGGQYIQGLRGLARDIIALQNSDSVAIIFEEHRHEGDGGLVFDFDMVYMLSTDQGVTWGPKTNITNYTSDSLWRAAGHLSGLWGGDDQLHVIWSARELYDSTAGYYYRCRILHWSSVSDQTSIIAEARYDLDCHIGSWRWDLNACNPSLSQCDGKLYALWTQFGDETISNDCSEGDYANGELYMSASDDWGLTWDTAVNLTNTRTPGCSPGDCESDNWSSMARYGMVYPDVYDTLDIIYVNDKDAGEAFNSRGTWTVNTVMHLRVPCRDVVHLPQISAEPLAIGYPTIVDTNSSVDTTISILNTGNGELTWEISVNYIDGGQYNWLTVDPSGGLIQTQPLNSQPVVVTLNSADLPGDPSVWEAEITIAAIDYPGVVSSLTIPVQLLVASDSHRPRADTLDTGCKALACFNTDRYGGDSPGYSLNIPGDCDTVDQYPDASYYLFDGSPLISWINEAQEKKSYTSIHSQNMTESGTFFPNGEFISISETDYDMLQYTASTTDSIFMVDVTLYAPTDGNHCFIVGKSDFYLRDGMDPATNVYLGQIFDWDIPSDSMVDNGSAYNADKNVIWQYGGEYHSDNQGNCDIAESDRLGGMALLSGSLLNAWTEPNADHVSGSAFSPYYLYSQMSTLSGYHPYDPLPGSDPLVDLHTGATFDRVDMVPGQKYSYTYVLLTTNEGEADFLNQLDAAFDWVVSQGSICCAGTPGDANADGAVNVGDAVYLISYIFKGGPAPSPFPISSGDPNGDCMCNVGDAVYLISYIFKGGPPPVTITSWIDGCGLPIR